MPKEHSKHYDLINVVANNTSVNEDIRYVEAPRVENVSEIPPN